jgi:diacylglycerol O-acyltransferase-1
MFISNAAETHIGPRAGNIIVWLSLIIGHPVGILMYYHDFVIDHYGIEEIKSFGQLGAF